MRSYYVYIMASRKNGELFIGVTNDLKEKVGEHRDGLVELTEKRGIKTLVWYKRTGSEAAALDRERQMKAWNQGWKVKLIEESNPEWKDLFDEIE
jgi:putative endonuclease